MGAPLGLLQAARFCLGLRRFAPQSGRRHACLWVVVKQLTLSYYMGEIILLSIYTQYGNIIYPVGEHLLASFVGVFLTQCACVLGIMEHAQLPKLN